MLPTETLTVGRVLCAITPEMLTDSRGKPREMDPVSLREADRSARTLGGTLSILSVLPPRSAVHADDDPGHLDALISWAALHTGRAPGTFEAHIERGDPAARIIERARTDGAGLIVVGTHDRRGVERWVLGSVAEAVVRQAPCPVMVTRGVPMNNGPILAACDLASSSPPVLLWAGSLAHRWACSLTALHAIQLNMSDVALVATALFSGSVPVQPDRESAEAITEAAKGALGAELSAARARGTPDVQSGPAAEVILARARALEASLVVIGTHSRTSIARFFLGSVAEKIVREAPCSVLVVR